MERAFQYLVYLFLRGVCALIRLLPFQTAMAVSRFIGRTLFYILGKRRKIALDNLRLAFGKEKSEIEIKRIAIQSFENLGMLGVEFIWIPKIVKNLGRFVRIKSDAAREALRQGKGLIFTVSHFGNWEWMAISSAADGLPMHAIARPLRNPFVYSYIKKLRGATGLECIDKHGAIRGVMRTLEQKEVVAILIDQHEREGSVRVPFFGRDAWTTTIPAMLALKKGVPVIPAFFFRECGTWSRVVMADKPLETIKTGDYERDIYENTKQYLKAIEDEVRRRPGDWLWMHRRWR